MSRIGKETDQVWPGAGGRRKGPGLEGGGKGSECFGHRVPFQGVKLSPRREQWRPYSIVKVLNAHELSDSK